MSNFTVSRVSSKEPRSWSFTDSRTGAKIAMESYTVMLEGESDPVEVNRKPGAKPQVGEVLTGTIAQSEYGPRFKAERKPFTPSQGRNNEEIKAEWAIGQAVQWMIKMPDTSLSDVEALARDFFAMVDRVKTGEPSGYAKAVAIAKNLGHKTDDDVFDVEDEKPINLDDIPF